MFLLTKIIVASFVGQRRSQILPLRAGRQLHAFCESLHKIAQLEEHLQRRLIGGSHSGQDADERSGKRRGGAKHVG